MENTNNLNYWNTIKNKKNTKKLTFIHTPKCAGSFVASVLKTLNIRNKGHNLALKNDGITFTVIRNPVDRFESLLNYRLNEYKPRFDWPRKLYYVWKDKSVTLNEIVKKMSDKEILNFKPFRTLCYWSKNIDIFISISNLEEFLKFFGYEVKLEKFKKVNVSKKTRGKFNEHTKNRISKIYADDMRLFKRTILE